ncbi:hypothetical protein [Methylobacterium sp. 77]|uniref:hypothetical protein n=1 Tax=Methylobacterium sp. 77 TaxID=1101192 RepID=UPI00037F4621|nr:hypothetical protein [Methylobacterium sp. 77]
MFLTEIEAETRLRDLHRERARIERAIADLTLFLDTGRQHSGGGSAAERGDRQFPPPPVSIPSQDGSPESVADRSLARREGRLLMDAACEILGDAGRPLHAAAILEGLTLRGLSVPGIDPVAALNTRLWKRSGPDGPFQRLGDAVYALSAGPDPDDE